MHGRPRPRGLVLAGLWAGVKLLMADKASSLAKTREASSIDDKALEVRRQNERLAGNPQGF
jgi:hypothetical protein